MIIDGTVNLEGAQGNPAIAIMKDSTLTIEGKTGIKNDKLYTTAKDGSQTHTIGTGIGTTQCKKYTSNGELSQLSGGNLVIRNVYIKPEGSGFCAIGDRGKFDSTPSAVGFGNITIEDAQLQFSRKALGSYRSPDIGSSLGKIILKGTNRIGATNGIFSEVGYEVEGKTQTDASARIEIVSVDEGITLSPYLIVGTYQPARLSYTLAEGIDTVKKGVYFDITNGTYTPDGKIKATKLGNYTVIQITAKLLDKAVMPNASFDAGTMKLTNVEDGMKYAVDETTWNDISASEADLSEKLTKACTIKIAKKGDGTTTADSDAQEIVVTKAKKPASPTLKAKTATSIEVNTVDGQEYRLGADGAWQTSGVFTDIDAYTDYEIYTRVAGKGTVLPSDPSDELAVKTECNHAQQRTVIDGKAATCTEAGYKAHYQCPCGKLFDAETGGNEITDLEAWKAGDGKIAAAHKLTKTEAKAATCTEGGNNAYWTCETCQKVFKDAEGTTETTVAAETLAALGHTMNKTEAKAATCTETGNNAYWTCETCHKVFKDAKGETETIVEKETLSALGHKLTKVNETPATCTVDGNIAYWTCSVCKKNFTDDKEENEIADLEAWKAGDGKIAAAHDWKEAWESIKEYHWHACTKCDAKKDPSVHTPGPEATEDTPQTCTVCGYIITPATGHIDHSHRTLVEGKAATCTVDGWKDYYKCNGCDKLFDAETGGNEITLDAWKAGEGKIAAAHKLTKTDEVPATTTQYGVKAYWHCSECDKYFSDAEGNTEIADLDAWKQNEGRIDKKSSGGGGGGGSYTPIQKPVIEKNDNVKTELSSDGTKLTIKAEDGYEITDVLVNGVSKGAAGELTGLKTGDKVEIKTAKKAEPTQPTDPSTDKNAKLVKGIEDTSIILKSKLTENRKVLLTWTKSKGYKVDSYEVYRSVKKNSGYGKTAFFKTKDGNWSKYLNTKGLKAGKTYYYKVRGVRTIDGQKYYTQWSNKAWRTI